MPSYEVKIHNKKIMNQATNHHIIETSGKKHAKMLRI